MILAYHSIGSGNRYSQPVESFAEQMRLLGERFQVVPLHEAATAGHRNGRPLAAITFDDGFEDLYTCAFPVLRSLDFPFTVFLATAFLEEGARAFTWSPHYAGLKPLGWEQVCEMLGAGCTAGSHTHSHPRLSECVPQQIADEMRRSKSILETRLEVEITAFAYPFGQPHDYDRRAIAAARRAGYRMAFTSVQHSVGGGTNPYEIPRVSIYPTDERIDFLQKISGRQNFVSAIERLNSALIAAGIRRMPVEAPRAAESRS